MLFVDLVQNVDQVRYRIVFDNSPLNGIAENSAKCRFKPPCCFGCPGFYGFQNVNYKPQFNMNFENGGNSK